MLARIARIVVLAAALTMFAGNGVAAASAASATVMQPAGNSWCC